MAASYIVERVDTRSGEHRFEVVANRPTQADLKQRGWATYTLRRRDGSVVKRWRVVRNRNGNPKVETETPVNLEGVTTLNLERMLRAYERIVKHWPAKAADVRKINNEISSRTGFIPNDDADVRAVAAQRELFE
jgi:hypothetical protein